MGGILSTVGAIKTLIPSTPTLLVVKKTYPPSKTTATFEFNPTLGGGDVSFTGHTTYDDSTTWGPQYLFDNAYGEAWCNAYWAARPLFGQWIFPKQVIMKQIFIIPRSLQDDFPTSVTVIADSVTIGTYSSTTLNSNSGQFITYTGLGYNIQLNRPATTWRLEFDPNAFIGEIEFWGQI